MSKKSTPATPAADGAADVLTVDINDLTVEEVEIVEEVTGVAIDRAFDKDRPKGKLLRALAYISRRRTDPTFTLEDAGKLRVTAASDDPDPT